jgi:transglutaminase-like putative cysteine protease
VAWRLWVAAGLSAAAAGWVLAGVFASGWARVLAVAAAAAGAAVTGLALRRWPWGGWLPLPLAAGLGLLAMWPDSGGPQLIGEALQSGGISQPPVAFDPGWRFLLVAVTVLLAGVSVGLGQPRLAPLPGAAVVLVGVLVQPDGAAVVAVVGGLVFLAASLAVAVGGEEGGAAEFEVRRLLRGGGALAGLVAVLVVLSQFGFLFPSADSHEVIPPKRPEASPEVEDRVLFRVESDRALPLRLGVLDVYDGRGFLTPPYDTDRFERLSGAANEGVRATITVEDLGGHVLPGLASPAGVVSKSRIEVDPRTGQLRLPKTRARKGFQYTVVGAEVPSAESLEAAPPAPGGLSEFAEAGPPPPVVEDLLRAAPTSSYARVQYLRTALYAKVVAAGAGDPVDVPPGRVAELLEGKEGSPWEITAAEVLLARWAGVPARFGYGYYDPQGTGEIRPRNGATWLEAYFDGHGWVPITGSPPRAKSSFSRAPKKEDPLVKATDDLALVVYVPVRLTTVQLLYTQVRYWTVRVLPLALAVVAVWALVPSALRALRRWRRRQWARSPSARLLVAYAEFRDAAADLNIGSADATPLEFLAVVAPDDEHTQLAWLVTRGLWGDLRRDLTDDDIRAAEDMAASVLRRLRRAHPFSSRLTAAVSRTSLREPWSTEVPNAPRLALRRLTLAPTMVALFAFSTGTGPVEKAAFAVDVDVDVPAAVEGVELRREPKVEEAYGQAGGSSIVSEGRVFSLRRGDDVEGSLQVASFVGGVSAADPDVRRAVVKSIGRGQFRLIRIGDVRVYALDLPEQRFLLWFPPDGRSYALLVTRSTFELGDRLMAAVAGADASAPTNTVPVPDPRGGAPQ